MDQLGSDRKAFEANPLAFTNRVYFETSNCCNLTAWHPLCPSRHMGSPTHLPTQIITKVLSSLSYFGFRGELRFHMISEPLVDPRLLWLIREAHKTCPETKITIWTNGTILSEVLADELVNAGMTLLLVTSYTDAEHKRLVALSEKLPIRVNIKRSTSFDHSLIGQYDAKPLNLDKPCSAPLNNLSIACNGRLVLCCRDWAKRHTFGDLHEESLEDILRKPEVWETYERLQAGDRFLPLCQRCERTR